MKELLVIISGIKRDVQGLKNLLVQFSKTNAKRLGEEWLKTSEASRALHCSSKTVLRLTASGHLPFSKVGGTIYVKTSDIEKVLQQNYKSFSKN